MGEGGHVVSGKGNGQCGDSRAGVSEDGRRRGTGGQPRACRPPKGLGVYSAKPLEGFGKVT